MRRPAPVFGLLLLLLMGAAAPAGKPGCSCSTPPQTTGGAVGPRPVSAVRDEVRRERPPLYDPATPPPNVAPMELADAETGTVYRFEDDGQHVTAVDKDGAVRWRRNPVAEAGGRRFSKDGKVRWPVIYWAGPPGRPSLEVLHEHGKSGRYISVGLSTKEFGVLDAATGDYTSMGSD